MYGQLFNTCAKVLTISCQTVSLNFDDFVSG